MKKALALLILLAAGWYFPLAWPQLGSRTGLDKGALGRGDGDPALRKLVGISNAGLELFLGLGSYGQWYRSQQSLLQWSEDLTKGVWTATNATTTATTFTPSAQNGQVVQSFTTENNVDYVLSAKIASAGNTSLQWVLGSTTQAVTVTSTPTRYSVTFTGDGTSWNLGLRDPNTSGFGAITFTEVQLEVGTTASAYQKTEDFQTVTDFSGKGRHAQNGSTTGEDTNDADLRQPWSRNVMPKEYVNDLTNWTCSGTCTVVDSDTVQLDPGSRLYFWGNVVANTYKVFSVSVAVTSGSGTVYLTDTWAQSVTASDVVSSGRVYARSGGNAYVYPETFTGIGLNDMSVNFGYNFSCAVDYRGQSYSTVAAYKIEIDSTGTPDTFKWSHDGGSTWEATGVAITGSAQTLECGVQVTFGSTTGHTLGDSWTSLVYYGRFDVVASSSNPGPITVDITNPQVEYCEDINCTPTPFTDPRTESVVASGVFDGVDDGAVVPTTMYDHNNTAAGTFIVVVSPLSQSGNAIMGDSGGSYGWSINTYFDNMYKFCVLSAGGCASSTVSELPGVWHVLVGVYDGNGTVELYIDGGSAAQTGGVSPVESGVGLAIGARGQLFAFYHGNIGPALVYSRALSEAEVKRATCTLARKLWNWKGIPIRGAVSACPSLDLTQEPLYASLTDRELNNLLLAQSLQVFDLTRLFRRVV